MTVSDNKQKGYGYFERELFPHPDLNTQPIMKINYIRSNRRQFLNKNHCTSVVLILYTSICPQQKI